MWEQVFDYFVEESDKIISNDVVLVYGIVERCIQIALAVMFHHCLHILLSILSECFVTNWLRG